MYPVIHGAAPEKERRVTEFPGGDAAHLSGLRVLSSLRACSPGRRFAPPPGKERRVTDFPGGDAAHLSGLRVLSSLRPGSPGRRFAPPPKKSAEWQDFPEAMLRICPGYASSAACGPVARLSAARAGGLSAILPKLAHQRLGLLLVA